VHPRSRSLCIRTTSHSYSALFQHDLHTFFLILFFLQGSARSQSRTEESHPINVLVVGATAQPNQCTCKTSCFAVHLELIILRSVIILRSEGLFLLLFRRHSSRNLRALGPKASHVPFMGWTLWVGRRIHFSDLFGALETG
jgi:hypothetical protein